MIKKHHAAPFSKIPRWLLNFLIRDVKVNKDTMEARPEQSDKSDKDTSSSSSSTKVYKILLLDFTKLMTVELSQVAASATQRLSAATSKTVTTTTPFTRLPTNHDPFADEALDELDELDELDDKDDFDIFADIDDFDTFPIRRVENRPKAWELGTFFLDLGSMVSYHSCCSGEDVWTTSGHFPSLRRSARLDHQTLGTEVPY
jgi:hypothetical protein